MYKKDSVIKMLIEVTFKRKHTSPLQFRTQVAFNGPIKILKIHTGN